MIILDSTDFLNNKIETILDPFKKQTLDFSDLIKQENEGK
jgi:hypothetical protein